MPPAIQILSSSTVHAIISLGVGASGSDRHSDAGWSLRGASFSASAVEVTWVSSAPVAPPIAYTDFSTAATAMPCRAALISGKPAHVVVARSITETVLRACPADRPPTATRRASAMATPRSLRGWGSAGNDVQESAAGSYASTVGRSAAPSVPPTAYTTLSSDATPSISRGVGIAAPSFHELPSKTSVVFSSLPLAPTPPVTTRRSPTTAAAPAARGCNRGGSSTQRLLTTRQTLSDAISVLAPSDRQPPSTTGFPSHVTDIACCTGTGRSSPPFQLSMAGS